MKYYLNTTEETPFPKFDYQINTLEEMGYQVYYLGIEKDNIYLCNGKKREFLYKITNYRIPGVKILSIYDALYKATIITVGKGIKFEYAYVRYMPVSFAFKKALADIKKSNCKVIVEIPTHPIEKEINSESRIARKLFFKLSNNYFIQQSKYVDLFALIGEKSNVFLNRPAINIENGIYIKQNKLRNYQKSDDEIHILGLANIANWHGYDRIIEGIKEYIETGGSRNIKLHLIGNDGDGSLAKLRKLSIDYNLSNVVYFEGPKYGAELDFYFDKCALALGSLGLHRIGYTSASTLKVREYMSRGIPFVIGASDQSIDNKDYMISVPNNNNAINIQTLIDFYDGIDDWNKVGSSMRKYAQEHMTWNNQFQMIFQKLET